MDLSLILIAGIGALLVLFMLGIPVFISFLLLNISFVFYAFGQAGFGLFANSVFASTTSSTLASIPMFILMGEVLFRSGTVEVLLDSTDRLIGRVKGRQYYLTVALATVFGALSGSAVAVAGVLGRALVPGMLQRKYDEKLTLGTVLAGASLAPIIPPSIAVIIIGSLVDTSIAKLLVGGILPGLFLAGLFVLYIAFRSSVSPGHLPEATSARDEVNKVSVIRALARLLPFSIVIFSVVGLILLGVATPSESAATGVMASFVVAAWYRKLNFVMVIEAVKATASMAVVILVIMASSQLFSQLLAFTGATRELVDALTHLGAGYWTTLALLMFVPFVLCMFIDQIALMLVIIPIYLPIVNSYGYDQTWFWMLFLINLTVGSITPPFGYTLFALRAAVPEISVTRVFSSAWPFVALFVAGITVIAVFPAIVTFLPSLM
jgi:tripartite ATP-independent transporter DctM subunit